MHKRNRWATSFRNAWATSPESALAGERQYREGRQHHYEWLVERKASVIEENKKRQAEAERAERERLAALERDRINRLLRDAAAFRKAADIRSFVADVDYRYRTGEVPVSEEELTAWCGWALEQAERIDPVRSGRFVASIKDKAAGGDRESDVNS